MADAAVFADGDVRMGEEVVANFRAAINRDETMQDGVAADFDLVVHKTVGTNMRAGRDFRSRRDYGGWVDLHGEFRRGMKDFDRAREIEIGIRRAQHGDTGRGLVLRNDDCRSLRRVERGPIFAIDQKSEVSHLRFFDTRDVSNVEFGVAIHRAAEQFCNFPKFHRSHLVIVHWKCTSREPLGHSERAAADSETSAGEYSVADGAAIQRKASTAKPLEVARCAVLRPPRPELSLLPARNGECKCASYCRADPAG